MNTIKLERVQYMPKQLAPGILYVSEKYSVAGHLCSRGCGNKVVTPLGPAEWSFTECGGLPSLWPSIGNWQLPCRSHYVINQGRIDWAGAWTDAQVLSGRRAEEQRRRAYYASKQPPGVFDQLWQWLGRTFAQAIRSLTMQARMQSPGPEQAFILGEVWALAWAASVQRANLYVEGSKQTQEFHPKIKDFVDRNLLQHYESSCTEQQHLGWEGRF